MQFFFGSKNHVSPTNWNCFWIFRWLSVDDVWVKLVDCSAKSSIFHVEKTIEWINVKTHLSGLSLLEVFSLLESSSYFIIALSSHIDEKLWADGGWSMDECSDEVDWGDSRLCSCFTITLDVSTIKLSLRFTLFSGFSFPTISDCFESFINWYKSWLWVGKLMPFAPFGNLQRHGSVNDMITWLLWIRDQFKHVRCELSYLRIQCQANLSSFSRKHQKRI